MAVLGASHEYPDSRRYWVHRSTRYRSISCGRSSGHSIYSWQVAAATASVCLPHDGDYKKLLEYRGPFQRLAPEVILDMIPITEQDALDVVATFRGIARRTVAASSQDVYRAWGYVTGRDSGPVDPQITEDSPLRESRYPYRGRKLSIYTEWNLENYDKILVERAFQSDLELPATILRLPIIRSRRNGTAHLPVSETYG